MRVLITGSSGMVGKNLTQFFQKNTNFELITPSSSDLNLLDGISVEKFILKNKPDVIVHCAGKVGGIQANISLPYTFLNNNLLMGVNLVNAAIKGNIEKLVNLGSSCMYPKEKEGPYLEEDILNGKLEPTNEGYAIAKITVARLCEFAYKEYGFKYKTIIPCNLYGKYDKFDPLNSHMVPAVIRKINQAKKANSSVEIWGDGSARREFMYAEDLCDFINFGINNYDKIDFYTNVGLGYDYSVFDYYKIVGDIVGFQGNFEFDLTKPIGMDKKLCSILKQNKLGWAPKHSLIEGITKTNKYFIENYEI